MTDKDSPPAIEMVVRQTMLFTGLLDDGCDARKVGVRDAWKQMMLNMKIKATENKIR